MAYRLTVLEWVIRYGVMNGGGHLDVVSFACYNECQRGYEKDGWYHFACLLCVSVPVSCVCVLGVGC